MEVYLRQYFDALLREAAGNFAERCVYRAGGPDAARAAGAAWRCRPEAREEASCGLSAYPVRLPAHP